MNIIQQKIKKKWSTFTSTDKHIARGLSTDIFTVYWKYRHFWRQNGQRKHLLVLLVDTTGNVSNYENKIKNEQKMMNIFSCWIVLMVLSHVLVGINGKWFKLWEYDQTKHEQSIINIYINRKTHRERFDFDNFYSLL
jgi:hypothetical protein